MVNSPGPLECVRIGYRDRSRGCCGLVEGCCLLVLKSSPRCAIPRLATVGLGMLKMPGQSAEASVLPHDADMLSNFEVTQRQFLGCSLPLLVKSMYQ